jgi:hypothetical protein
MVFVFLAVQFVSSCTPCDKYECAVDGYGSFKIISSDGKDLLFGPHKRYNVSQIRFYAVSGSDTSYFESRAGVHSHVTDSFLYVSFKPMPDTAYMRLSDGDIDTLAITSVRHERGRCCPATTEITDIRLNGKDFGGVEIIK